MLAHDEHSRDGYLSHMDDSRINDHLDWLRRKTSRVETHHQRHDNLRRIHRWLQTHRGTTLEAATASDLNAWQLSLTVAPTSVNTYTSHLRGYYRWLHDAGHRKDDPSASLPRNKLPKRLPRPIPENHLELAFRCADPTMTVWLALAGWCGLRAGEIARLRGDSVIDDPGGMLLRIDGKGGHERIVPVPDEVAELLRLVMTRGPLFRRPQGLPASPSYVSRVSSEFFRQLGLPYTLHWCRHRFGTQHYKLCKDIRLTQDLMGHASPSTTAMYVAVSRPAAVRSIQRLARSIPKPKPRRRLE